MRRLALLLALVFAGALGAAADVQALPDAARSALEDRASAMTAALLAGDAARMFDFLPPPMVAKLAASVGRTPDAFRQLFIENAAQTKGTTGVTEHRLDLSAATLFPGPDGATYVLIPTDSLAFDPYRGRFRVTAITVGIPMGETWHFMTIADATGLALLVETYPALATAPLASATLTPAP